MSKYGVISGPYFPVFGREITPYAVIESQTRQVFFSHVSHLLLSSRMGDVALKTFLLLPLSNNFSLKIHFRTNLSVIIDTMNQIIATTSFLKKKLLNKIFKIL